MKELKDFNTEKSIYIGKVLNHIHYKKLHTRIYEEISAHLDDMYEDFSSNCDDEEEITRKVLEENYQQDNRTSADFGSGRTRSPLLVYFCRGCKGNE